jgi:hypothetical protein
MQQTIQPVASTENDTDNKRVCVCVRRKLAIVYSQDANFGLNHMETLRDQTFSQQVCRWVERVINIACLENSAGVADQEFCTLFG